MFALDGATAVLCLTQCGKLWILIAIVCSVVEPGKISSRPKRYERSLGIMLAPKYRDKEASMATREDLARAIGAQVSPRGSREPVGTHQDKLTIDPGLIDGALSWFTSCITNVLCSARNGLGGLRLGRRPSEKE